MSEKKVMPKRVNVQTKSAYAAEKLRGALAQGRYARGEWLRAQGVAEELGLSLTPVREAMLELASEGLIDMVPYRGARVAEIPMVNLSEVYIVRGLLEGAATGLAAARFSRQGLVKLAAIHTLFQKTMQSGDHSQLRELSDQFHFAIYDAAGVPLIRSIIKSVWARAPRDTFGILPKRPDRSLHEHGIILEALQQRDPRAAEAAMRHHIEEAFALIRTYREET